MKPNVWYRPTPEGPTIALHVPDPMAALLHFQARFAPHWEHETDHRAAEIIKRQSTRSKP